MADAREELVARLFRGTGTTYDSMVNLATFGMDRLWKRKILSRVPPAPTRILDLACGTGIVTFAIARRFPRCRVIGVDITKEYLEVAIAKAGRWGVTNVEFLHGRAEDALFDEPFDCVTASYLPKYADLPRLAANVRGMLKEGGVFIVHDFTYPDHGWAAGLWEFYFRLLQTVGTRIWPRWRTIFYGLPEVVRATRWVPELESALDGCGFRETRVERLVVGSAAIVTAKK